MAEPVLPLAAMAAALTAASSDAVAVRELPPCAQVDVRAGEDAARALGLPVAPDTTARDGARTALWLGPDEWLVVAPGDDAGAIERDLLARTRDGDWVSLVDVSASRTVLELRGPRARDVLAKGCSLDLHPAVFGPGRCAQTLLALAQVLLEARTGDVLRIFVRCSFARYLALWLLDAMAEYTPLTPPPAAGRPPAAASAPSARPR